MMQSDLMWEVKEPMSILSMRIPDQQVINKPTLGWQMPLQHLEPMHRWNKFDERGNVRPKTPDLSKSPPAAAKQSGGLLSRPNTSMGLGSHKLVKHP